MYASVVNFIIMTITYRNSYLKLSHIEEQMKLFVSDLDGTLLNSNLIVSDNSVSIINDLIDNYNLNFTVATARSLASAWDLISKIKLKYPIILSNGVFVYDPITKSNILENIFSASEAITLIKLYEEYKLNPIVHTIHPLFGNKIFYKGIFNKGENEYFQEKLSKNDKRLFITNNYSEIIDHKIVKIYIINTKDNIDPLYKVVKNNYNYCYHYAEDIYSKFYWLETNHINANKRDSLMFMKKQLNIDKIVTFGDNFNDLQMFEISDECYAVSNAVEPIKNIATKVIDTNNNDGVATYLKSNSDNFR
jgi:5-amino-6-(5-phospho-D-ribitylamino)uracil phosphatase